MSSPIPISPSRMKAEHEHGTIRIPRRTSKAQNAAMREIIRPWASLSSLPPGCRTVSYSSWSKFSSSSENSKSKGDLLASVLWASTGTSPDYSPPVTEWCNLGTEDPVVRGNIERKPNHRREPLRKSSGSDSSWLTASSDSDTGLKDTKRGIDFRRVPVRDVSTSSLLTTSLQSQLGAGLQERMSPSELLAREMKERMLQADTLPSAFDDDSEDEGDDEWEMEAL